MTGLASLPALNFSQWQQQSRIIDHVQVAFIVGPPKCGTTWLMLSLNGHRNAVVSGEGNAGRALVTPMLALLRAFNAHQVKYGQGPTTQLDDMDAAYALRQLIDRQFIRSIAAAAPAKSPASIRCVMDKTPSNAQHVGQLAAIYPQAKFICCVRDVCDGAVSGWFHFHKEAWIRESTLEDYARTYAVQTWAVMLRAARAAGASLGSDRYMEWSYEAATTDPAKETSRVLNFLGLSADETSIGQCLAAGEFSRHADGRLPGQEADSFFRKGVVGDHVNHLSPALARELRRLADEALRNPPAITTSAAEPKSSTLPAVRQKAHSA